jgi:alcohol dehydrogenase (NADP+)
MVQVKGYAAPKAREPLQPFQFERRTPGPHDVQIDIKYCGVCHSDLHQIRDEWAQGIFPMVPGHEIVGVVEQVGNAVRRFKAGDTVGVGCLVDSCGTCPSCKEGLEQFCDGPAIFTYNAHEKDGKTPTYGGYSTKIVTRDDFVLSVSPKIPLANAAPLLCAGITTYSPLRHWNAGPGRRVGVLGLGGLGHMAVKLGAAMGAEVTVLSSSEKKRADAERLGAANYVATSAPDNLKRYTGYFDLIINTVSAANNVQKYIDLLKRDATMVLVGVPSAPEPIHAFPLILKRRSLAGSLIGGIKETQEMLDFCAQKGIGADIELIPMNEINNAYERMLKGDVRYRFVIDLQSLK